MRKLYKNIITSLSVLALISVLFTSCKTDEPTVVVIKAVDESNMPVVGANIHAEKGSIDTTGTTNSAGEWSLELKLPAILDATVSTAESVNKTIIIDSTISPYYDNFTGDEVGYVVNDYTYMDVTIIDSLKGTGGLRFEEHKTVKETIVLRPSYSDTLPGTINTYIENKIVLY